MIRTRTTIKKFISAKTPEELEKAMLLTNQSLGSSFDFEDIQYAQGMWWAWFYADIGVIRASDLLEKPLTRQDKKNKNQKVDSNDLITKQQ